MVMGIQCHHFFSIQTYLKKFRKTKVVRTVEEKLASDNFNFLNKYRLRAQTLTPGRQQDIHSTFTQVFLQAHLHPHGARPPSRNTNTKLAKLFSVYPLEDPDAKPPPPSTLVPHSPSRVSAPYCFARRCTSFFSSQPSLSCKFVSNVSPKQPSIMCPIQNSIWTRCND